MKIKAFILSICLIVTPIQNVNANACETVLCMFGLVSGQFNGACASAVGQFFAIKKFTGFFDTFNPVLTAALRRTYLGGCTAPGIEPFIDSIIITYGYVESL